VFGPETVQGVVQILSSMKVAGRVADLVPERTLREIKANANINVSSEGVFVIEFQDADPEICTSVANAYPLAGSHFLEEETGIGIGAESVKTFVEEQIIHTEARADSIRGLLSDFLQRNEVIAVDRELSKMMDLYANLRTQRFTDQIAILENDVRNDALIEEMGLAGTYALDNFLGTNQVILNFRSRAANLEIRIAELKQTYTEEHPEVLAVKAALAETETMLKEEIEKIFESYTESPNPIVGQMKENYIALEIRQAILHSKTNILDKAISELEDSFLDLSSVQYDYAKLEKESLMLSRLLTSLTLKLEGLKFQELQSSNRFVILEEATVPRKPAYPNFTGNLLVSLALSLLVSIFICLIWEGKEAKMRESMLEEMTSEDLKGVFFGD
jgi:capsular polysaccharide biosynthesis protein